MLPITSSKNSIVTLARSLHDKKGRRETGLFLAEGLAMLERACSQGWRPEHLIATKEQNIWDDLKPAIVTDKLMAELSGMNNPLDVLGVFKSRFQPHPTKTGLWLALEEIRDPGNLGTIIRTADAAGVHGIILAGDCCDPYSPECVRASTGSIFALPLVRMNPPSLLDFMRGWPGECVGTAMQAKPGFRRSYGRPTLLVMGSESRGLSSPVMGACHTLVNVPMRAGAESLNLAVATAVMLYEINRESL